MTHDAAHPPEAAAAHLRVVRPGERLDLGGHPGPFGDGVEVTSDGPAAGVLGYLVHHGGGRPFVAPVVVVRGDRLEACLDLRAPAGDERELERAELEAALAAAGVAFGLEPNRVDAAWRIFSVRGEQLRPMWVARGRAPVPGRPERIDWAEGVDPEARFEEDAEGRVDFHRHSSVRNLSAGQVLGVFVPGGEPRPGVGIDGAEVALEDETKPLGMRIGRNVATVEQAGGSFLLKAEIDGVLVLEDGMPSVSDVLHLSGDVDYATGNVDATGTVIVEGSVRRGFVVRAKDDVVVHGVVEGGSIHAGGFVDLRKGLIGGEDARVFAGKGLRLLYAQNAEVSCRGDIELLDADMGSALTCSGELLATQGRGRLRGGTYRAARGIRARELGSELGAQTVVEAGADVLLEAERKDLTAALDTCRAAQREAGVRARRSGPGRGVGPGRAADRGRERELARREQELLAAIAGLPEPPPLDPPASITASGQVHFGVEVVLRGVRLRPSETTGGRRFTFDPLTQTIESDQP